MNDTSWSERLFGGFRKTSERLANQSHECRGHCAA